MADIDHVTEAIGQWQTQKPVYDLYRNYYRGQHELQFATQDFKAKHGDTFKSLRENLCKSVVTAHTDRIAIEGWGDDTADEARDQGMSRLAGMVHREVFRCGDAYSVTWESTDGPKARFRRADQIVPVVDEFEPDRLKRASQVWEAGGYGRVNVIDDQRMTRWVTREKIDAAKTMPDTSSAWMPHRDEDGAPELAHSFGTVPVCWWRLDADDVEGYGNSVLSDVIPLQNGLNKGLADLLVLSETYARPFWYLLNFRPQTDNPAAEWAQEIEKLPVQRKFDPNRQQIVTHDGEGPFGQLDPPDLMRLIEQQREMKNKISSVAGIPSYYFSQTSGQVPSGESLRVLTSRLISAVRDFTDSATPVWRGQAQLLGMGETAAPKWADPMPMDETERITNAEGLQRLGLSIEDVVSYLGFPDGDLIVSRAVESQARQASAMGRAFMSGDMRPAAY